MASAEAMADIQDKSESKHLMVCAIDFGTTFTGFAFSFRDKYAEFIMSGFQGGDSKAEKAPTCLLLNPDESFYKFGFAAKARYKELLEDGEADKYFFFERFKMKLYETKNIRPDVKIADSKNKLFPAMDIFSKVIQHLREEIERSSKAQVAGLQPDDILWVLTVPAIWSDSAKSFMRKAAVRAGISEEHLVLCLEPEAASLWCLREKACKTAAYDGTVERRPLPEGQKYIIADLGGGTADLSVHEILSDRNLREIRRSDGGAFGGNLVNDAFFELLQGILGPKVIERLNKSGAIMCLEEEFEKKKKHFKEDQNDSYRISLPVAEINEAILEVNDNESLEEKFAKASDRYCNNIALINKKHIEIKKPVFEQFFATAVDGIVGFIKQLRNEDELNEINVIFMVGGFSEAPYIQNTIQKRVPGLRVLIPPDPAYAVMKGAVLMGHKPRTITSKITRFTYGLSVLTPFQKAVDPERFKCIRDGIEYCNMAFSKLVQRGQIYKPGDEYKGAILTHFGLGLCTDLAGLLGTLETSIYRSEDTDPKYADSEFGCEIGGQICIPPPQPFGWPPITHFRPTIVLGQSEISVKVVKLTGRNDVDGQPIKATLEFM